jgi:hypothetical protein
MRTNWLRIYVKAKEFKTVLIGSNFISGTYIPYDGLKASDKVHGQNVNVHLHWNHPSDSALASHNVVKIARHIL